MLPASRPGGRGRVLSRIMTVATISLSATGSKKAPKADEAFCMWGWEATFPLLPAPAVGARHTHSPSTPTNNLCRLLLGLLAPPKRRHGSARRLFSATSTAAPSFTTTQASALAPYSQAPPHHLACQVAVKVVSQ